MFVIFFKFPGYVFAGTVVASGRGKAMVVDTGMNTKIGKLKTLDIKGYCAYNY